MRSGRPPTLWCDLMVTDGPPVNDTLSITSDKACPVPGTARRRAFWQLILKHFDEDSADRLALGLRLDVEAVERREELLCRINVDERNVEVAAEQAHDLLGFA